MTSMSQKKEVKAWLTTAKGINARAKALHCECAPLKSRFCPSSSMRFPIKGGNQPVAKDADTSVMSRINGAKNRGSLNDAYNYYRKSISSLRNHTSVALESLKNLEEGNVSKFDANRKCEKAIQSYENEVAKTGTESP